MSALAERLRLVLVTPGRAAEPGGADALVALARAAVRGGATAVWLRERALPRGELAAVALRVRDAVRPLGAAVLLSGDVDLALELELDAVQLGFRDVRPEAARARAGRRLSIGVSAHDPLDAAALAACDYAVLAPLHAVPGKGAALGLERFAACVRACPVPVVALGGIDAGNAASALAAGAAGVAVLRALAAAADPAAAARAIARALAAGSLP